MKIFIANIDSISKHSDIYSALLLPVHRARLSEFKNEKRKLQFILGHLMADKRDEKYTSIAHKDNFVVIATDSKQPVGIDIENTDIKRDFIGLAETLKMRQPKSLDDFYKMFTEFEAAYKMGSKPICTKFIKHNNYLICITSTTNFKTPKLNLFDINSLLSAEQE